MNTSRYQDNHRMSTQEKQAFIKITKTMPWLYSPILTTLTTYAHCAKTLTDIACGDGYLLQLIHKKWKHLALHGIDADTFMIQHAPKTKSITFKKLPAEKFSQSQDIIICNLAFHHFKNPVAVIKNISTLSSVLIVSDQLRPETTQELQQALKTREIMLGKKDHPFYKKNEERSILEAYTKKEVQQLFAKTKIPYTITYFMNDYYTRFVAVFTK